MQYLFLTYHDDRRLMTMLPIERDILTEAHLANAEQLHQSGRLLAVADLQSRHTVTTVRVSNGRVAVTAGPIDETNHTLRELFFIEARDLNEAIQVAAQMPQVRHGPIEVRPMTEFAADQSSYNPANDS